MKVDPIKTKVRNPFPSPAKQKNFIIPIIIFALIIAAIWLLTLRYNFSRLDSKSQNTDDSATQEVSAALKNLTEEFDKLKQTKIFKANDDTPSVPPPPSSENLPVESSTTTKSEPSLPQQY